MAKLFFIKSMGTPSRDKLAGILSDDESTINESKYNVIDISTSDFNNFVSHTKDFTVGANNTLTWFDSPTFTDDDGNAITQNKAVYEEEIRQLKEELEGLKYFGNNHTKISDIDTFISELDAIDTDSLTYPITGNVRKDIYSRCSNSINPWNLKIT